MTIKELQKVYRKVVKLVKDFNDAKCCIERCSVFGDYEYITEHAKKLAASSKKLHDIHVRYGLGDEGANIIMYHISTEEDFIVWMLTNVIDNTVETAV